MSQKKPKGKQAWCRNTVAILKPYVERKEHITRSTAGRLVRPVTNWQMRELDKLRKQANQIIRGEAVSPLTYTVFGVSLEHPMLHEARDLFAGIADPVNETLTRETNGMVRDALGDDFDWTSIYVTSSTPESTLVWPPKEPLRILGMERSEYDVFRSVSNGAYCPKVGDAWFVRNEYGRGMHLVYVENDNTYILFPLDDNNNIGTRARRYVYPECVHVEDVTVQHTSVEDVITAKPDVAPVTPKVHETLRAYAEIAGVSKVRFVESLPTYGRLKESGTEGELFDIDDLEDIGIATVGWDGEDWVDAFDPTKKVPRSRYRTYIDQAPPVRENPTHTLVVADPQAVEVLDAKYLVNGFYKGSFEKHTYVKHGSVWVEGQSYDAYIAVLTEELKSEHDTGLIFDHEAAVLARSPSELKPGTTYMNKANNIVVWANNEWVVMGPICEEMGLWCDVTGMVHHHSHHDLMAKKLGCDITYIDCINSWSELPDRANKGDYYSLCIYECAGDWLNAVWDGEIWVSMKPPHKPIVLPVFVSAPPHGNGDVMAELQDDWAFVEPAPNPNGFWQRLGRWFGFK